MDDARPPDPWSDRADGSRRAYVPDECADDPMLAVLAHLDNLPPDLETAHDVARRERPEPVTEWDGGESMSSRLRALVRLVRRWRRPNPAAVQRHDPWMDDIAGREVEL